MRLLHARPTHGLTPCLTLTLLAAQLAFSPATASADARQLYVLSDGSLHCGDLEGRCVAGSGCSLFRTCGAIGPAGSSTYCHHGTDSFLCCTANSDCELHDSATGTSVVGTCVSVGSAVTISDGGSVCVFDTGPGSRTFCNLEDPVGMANCLTGGAGATGLPTNDWGIGNCDADGASNGPEVVAGCDVCDPTRSPPDCSPPPIDSGVRDTSVPRDSSTSTDSSTATDTGVTDGATDALIRPDTDGAPTDGAGPGSDGERRFRGAGGCTCGVAQKSTHNALWLGLPLVFLALMRKSRWMKSPRRRRFRGS